MATEKENITTVTELFESILAGESEGSNVSTVEKFFSVKIRDLMAIEFINYMTDEPLVLEDGIRLMSLNEVYDFEYPKEKIVPIFDLTEGIYICYDAGAKNYCKFDINEGDKFDSAPSINFYFREALEELEKEGPEGENTSIPFVIDYKGKPAAVVFGYDMKKDKNGSFFSVGNIIVEYDEYEHDYACNIRVPIDAKKWQEVYKPVLDTYKEIGNNQSAIDELDKFLQTDLTNKKLRAKYKGLIEFMEKEESDLMEAHALIAEDENISQEDCYEIVHKYSNHAKVSKLYEKVMEYVLTLNIE